MPLPLALFIVGFVLLAGTLYAIDDDDDGNGPHASV